MRTAQGIQNLLVMAPSKAVDAFAQTPDLTGSTSNQRLVRTVSAKCKEIPHAALSWQARSPDGSRALPEARSRYVHIANGGRR